MNIRERKFAEHYVLDAKTKGNGEQSAIKAGYSIRCARGNVARLIAKDCVKSYIEELMTQQKALLEVNLEKKIAIAWQQHLKYVKEDDKRMAHVWFEEHGKLCGDYIQKTEITDKTDYSAAEEKEIIGIRNRIASEN